MPSPSAHPTASSGGFDGSALMPVPDGNFAIALGLSPLPGYSHGLHLLDRVPIFNLLWIPGENDAATVQTLQGYCQTERAFFIVNAPPLATTAGLSSTGPVGSSS
jgi:hypothetical protein